MWRKYGQVYGKEGMGDAVPFSAAEAWGAKVLAPLLDQPFVPRTLVNVNFPAIAPESVKGIQVVRQGFHDYSRGSIVKGTDPRGYDYYWFGLHGVEHPPRHDPALEVVAPLRVGMGLSRDQEIDYAIARGIEGRIALLATNPHLSPPELLRDNPLSKIPCLITDDGIAVYDSRVICEYLDSLAPSPRLIPDGPAHHKPVDGGHRVVVIVEGFAHAHQHDVGDGFAALAQRPGIIHHLRHDFAARKVTAEAHLPSHSAA